MSERILYPMKEAATLLAISVSTLEQLIAQGEIRICRIGKRVLVPRKELEKAALRDHEIVWPARKSSAQVTQ